jgi:glycerol-3-phosphate cytidylyltransferase
MSKKVGYTTGVFDLFHIGHLNILKRARQFCDELVVGVTTDELAKSRKGRSPVIAFDERIAIVRSIRYVDRAVPQSAIDEVSDWKKYKFDILFKGDDWRGSLRWLKLEEEFAKLNVEVVFLPYTNTTSSRVIRAALDSPEPPH